MTLGRRSGEGRREENFMGAGSGVGGGEGWKVVRVLRKAISCMQDENLVCAVNLFLNPLIRALGSAK